MVVSVFQRDNLDPASPGLRLQEEFHMAEMPLFPQLPLEQPLGFNTLLDRLAMDHPRFTHIHAGVKLPKEAVGDNLQVQFSHAGNDRLGGLIIVLDPQCGVFLHQFTQGDGQFLLVGRRLGLDRQRDDRFIEFDRFEEDGMGFITDRIARRDILESHDGDDVSGACLFHAFPLIGVHFQQPGDLFFLPAACIVKLVPRVEPPRIDPEIGELPPFILHDLEGQGGQRLPVAARPDLLLLGHGVHPLHRGDLFRRGKKIDDRVENRLNALVPQGRTAHDGDHLKRDCRLPDGGDDLLVGNLHPVKIFLGNGVVGIGQNGNHPVPMFHRLRQDLIRNLTIGIGKPLVRIIPGDKLPTDQIHDPPEEISLPEGNLDRQGQRVEPLLHHSDRPGIVRPDTVHLVDEGHLGNTVLVGLVPDGLRLGLHPAHGAEDDHRPVQNAETPLDLDREIDMARCVDDVDLMVVPSAGGHRRCDGDPPLLFLRHPVHDGLAVVDLSHLVGYPGVEENPLRNCRLTGIDMGDYSDIPCA